MPRLRDFYGLNHLHYVTNRTGFRIERAGFRIQDSGVGGAGVRRQVSGVRCWGLNGDSGVRIQDTERKNRRQK